MDVGGIDQYIDLAEVFKREIGECLALFDLGNAGGDFKDRGAVARVADRLLGLIQLGRGACGQHHGLRLILGGTHGQLDTQARADTGLDVLASRSHGDAEALDKFLDGREVRSLKSAGSSLKICLVAAGEADLYPRLGRTMEWDIAAGHAVLVAAGVQIRTLAGDVLRYGKPGLDNPYFYAHGL